MLSYEEALSRILKRVPEPRSVTVPLPESLGHVLAASVTADTDLPPFNRSFMDGYALRSCDLKRGISRLEIVGVAAAGEPNPPPVGPGQAVQIMTGAPVPQGADAVQMVEKTRRVGNWVEIEADVKTGLHISPKGSEVRRGTVVLSRGRLLGPAEIAVLATFGHSRVPVFAGPSVAIVATGDELIEIDEVPKFGQIRNSNAHMLGAQCRSLSLRSEILPCVPDDPDRIRAAVSEGLQRDLLIFSGGVSMGEYDYVHKVLAEEEIEIFFHKVAIKPGKPLIVGARGHRMVFALPGNPVSSLITFEVFVKPAIRKWMGVENPHPRLARARLRKDVRQKPGRLFFKPANVYSTAAGLEVEPFETKGSADIVAFSRADSLMLFPAQSSFLAEGTLVEVLPLNAPLGTGGTSE